MARTGGYAPKPLPESLLVGLETLGYRKYLPPRLEQTPGRPGVEWRTVAHPTLCLTVATSNLAGDDKVIAAWLGQHATRITVDNLLDKLRVQIDGLNHPNKMQVHA